MSGGATLGASAVGAAASAYSSKKAGDAAADAQDSADRQAADQLEMAQQELDFQKQQYDDWENIFGPIQDNLSSYYQNLSPDSYATRGLQGLQESYSVSKKSLEQSLAQRGISDSGVAAAAMSNLEVQRMLGGAEIKANAEDSVVSQQSSFLGLGLGQQGALQSGIANSYGNLSNIYGQQSASNMAQSAQYSQQAASSMAGVGTSIGQGISTYMTSQALNNNTNNGVTWTNPDTAGGTGGIYGLDYK